MKTVKLPCAVVRALLCVLGLVFWAGWSASGEIIPPTNRIDWAITAGVEGGIPSRPVYTTLTGIDRTGGNNVLNAIQAAISNCPPNQAVLLPPGTYRIDGSLRMKSFVTLRGSGTNTILRTTAQIIFVDGGVRVTIPAVSGYSRGSTSLTLGSAPGGLQVGASLLINELNDPSFVCPWGYEIAGQPRVATYLDEPDGGTRVRGQIVRVTSVAGPVVTFTPPLHSYFGASRSPRVEYRTAEGSVRNVLTRSGIEDLTIDNNSTTFVKFEYSQNCWISNVVFNIRSLDTPSVQGLWTHHISVVHCTFNGFTPSASAVVPFVKNEGWLVENNIFNRVNQSFIVVGVGGGHVFAYNYTHTITNTTTAMIGELGGHGGHPQFTLLEGNVMWKFHADSIHGSGSHWTLFRNQVKGRKPGSTFGHGMLWFDQTNYFNNTVGNVLGYAGIVTSDLGWLYDYESAPGTKGPPNTVTLYRYGVCGYNQHTADPKCKATTLRHGNYDYIRNTVEWNPAIEDRDIPPSLYLTQKPGWFGNMKWPTFGPDVPGYVNMLPAEYRFFNNGAEPPPDIADTTPPTAPGTPAPQPTSTNRVSLSWPPATDDVGIAGYRLERSTGSGSTNFAQIATPGGNSHHDTGLLSGTTYNYRVRAADTSGNIGPYSEVATVITPMTRLATPTEVVFATFTSSPEEGTTPLQVMFESQTPWGTNVVFDLGDGATAVASNLTHVYTTPGVYTVTMTVQGPGRTLSVANRVTARAP